MRYLADECLGQLIVSGLRKRGHDAEWVRELASGISDEEVLAWSLGDQRILLTADFDYGELIFGRGKPAYGVIILRLSDFQGAWIEVATAVVKRLETMQSGSIEV